LKRKKENVMYINGDRIIIVVSIYKFNLIMKETFFNKGILKKLTKEGKSLTFYIVIKKVETLNKL